MERSNIHSEPNPSCFRAKRWLLLSSGVLLIHLTLGIDLENNSGSTIQIPISNKSYFGDVVAVLVLYFLFQLQIYWLAQNLEIREKPNHRFDYFSTNAIAIFSFSFYLMSALPAAFSYVFSGWAINQAIQDFTSNWPEFSWEILESGAVVLFAVFAATLSFLLKLFVNAYKEHVRLFFQRKSALGVQAREALLQND